MESDLEELRLEDACTQMEEISLLYRSLLLLKLEDGETVAAFEKRAKETLQKSNIPDNAFPQEKRWPKIEEIVYSAVFAHLKKLVVEAVDQCASDIMGTVRQEAQKIGYELDEETNSKLVYYENYLIAEKVAAERKAIKKILSAACEHLLKEQEEATAGGWEVIPGDDNKRFNLDECINGLWTLASQLKSAPSFTEFFVHLQKKSKSVCFPFAVWKKISENPGDDAAVFKEKLESVLTQVLPRYAGLPGLRLWCECEVFKQTYNVFLPRLEQAMEEACSRLSLGAADNAEQDKESLMQAAQQAAVRYKCLDVYEEDQCSAYQPLWELGDLVKQKLSGKANEIIHEVYLPKVETAMRDAMQSSDFPTEDRAEYLVKVGIKAARDLSFDPAKAKYQWDWCWTIYSMHRGGRALVMRLLNEESSPAPSQASLMPTGL